MQTKELRSKTLAELKTERSGLYREQFNLRFQYQNHTLTQTDNLRKVRRNIARVNTVIAEKLKAEGAAAPAQPAGEQAAKAQPAAAGQTAAQPAAAEEAAAQPAAQEQAATPAQEQPQEEGKS